MEQDSIFSFPPHTPLPQPEPFPLFLGHSASNMALVADADTGYFHCPWRPFYLLVLCFQNMHFPPPISTAGHVIAWADILVTTHKSSSLCKFHSSSYVNCTVAWVKSIWNALVLKRSNRKHIKEDPEPCLKTWKELTNKWIQIHSFKSQELKYNSNFTYA